MRKRFRLFLILAVTLGAVLSLWVWEVRGQTTRGIWECKKFVFGQANEPSHNTTRDLEAFLQAASQATMTSSGVPDEGPHRATYDVIACRQP
jgi:hypothetical protein